MPKEISLKTNDTIVHDVVKKFDERSAAGLAKYGKPLDKDVDSLFRWVNDVQEELMDAILYLQKVKQELTDKGEDKIIQEQVHAVYDDGMYHTSYTWVNEKEAKVQYEQKKSNTME